MAHDSERTGPAGSEGRIGGLFTAVAGMAARGVYRDLDGVPRPAYFPRAVGLTAGRRYRVDADGLWLLGDGSAPDELIASPGPPGPTPTT